MLIDALTEGLQDAETPEQWPIQRKLIEGDVHEGVALYPPLERIDVDRSFKQIRAAPPLRSIPLVVLSADRPWGPQVPAMIAEGKLAAEIPSDFGYVTDSATEESAGTARQACAKCKAYYQHEERPRNTQGTAATGDRSNSRSR